MTYTFEDIAIKRNAPQLLELALRKKKAYCMIGTGAMSDPYMPLEETERMTRTCLELIDKYGFGFSAITKSDLVLRDIDLLQSINRKAKCVVQMTLTTYDDALCRLLEPNVAVSSRRFEVLKELQKAGIPTVVWMTPILPFINDTEENIRGLAAIVIFFAIAYFTGNYLRFYLLALAAWFYIFSCITAEGLHKKGIQYFNGMTLIISTEKWENVDKVSMEEGKYIKLNTTGSNVKTAHTYPSTAKEKIISYLKSKNIVVSQIKTEE